MKLSEVIDILGVQCPREENEKYNDWWIKGANTYVPYCENDRELGLMYQQFHLHVDECYQGEGDIIVDKQYDPQHAKHLIELRKLC